jgi:hypothetical protein
MTLFPFFYCVKNILQKKCLCRDASLFFNPYYFLSKNIYMESAAVGLRRVTDDVVRAATTLTCFHQRAGTQSPLNQFPKSIIYDILDSALWKPLCYIAEIQSLSNGMNIFPFKWETGTLGQYIGSLELTKVYIQNVVIPSRWCIVVEWITNVGLFLYTGTTWNLTIVVPKSLQTTYCVTKTHTILVGAQKVVIVVNRTGTITSLPLECGACGCCLFDGTLFLLWTFDKTTIHLLDASTHTITQLYNGYGEFGLECVVPGNSIVVRDNSRGMRIATMDGGTTWQEPMNYHISGALRTSACGIMVGGLGQSNGPPQAYVLTNPAFVCYLPQDKWFGTEIHTIGSATCIVGIRTGITKDIFNEFLQPLVILKRRVNPDRVECMQVQRGKKAHAFSVWPIDEDHDIYCVTYISENMLWVCEVLRFGVDTPISSISSQNILHILPTTHSHSCL